MTEPVVEHVDVPPSARQWNHIVRLPVSYLASLSAAPPELGDVCRHYRPYTEERHVITVCERFGTMIHWRKP